MPTTDEEVQKQGEKLAKMREQLDDATRTREDRERELANDYTMAAMRAEEDRLQRALEEAKEAAKVSTVKAGASALIDTAGAGGAVQAPGPNDEVTDDNKAAKE